MFQYRQYNNAHARNLARSLAIGAILFAFGALPPTTASAQQLGESSLQELRAASAKGNPEADFQLGFMASMGRIPGQTPAKAYEHLRRAADDGHLEASFLLGTFYMDGFAGQQASPQAGARYLERAAERGHAGAQDKLGQYHLAQRNDPGEAARWFRMAAENGLASAENNLGLLYADGRGVGRDPARAAELIGRAANKGLPGAKHNLATLYVNGNGVAADPARARQLFEEAAQQGYQRSQYSLAMLNLKGEGVQQNPVEALKWLMLASAGAKDDAFRRQSRATLTRLIQQTSPAMVNDASEAARLWAMRNQMAGSTQTGQN